MEIIRKTIIDDESYLRQISSEVDFSDKSYLEDIEKLKDYCCNYKVWAMAPIQIGIPKRIIYMRNTTDDVSKNSDSNYNEERVFINPKIIKRRGLTKFLEACASCPDPNIKLKENYDDSKFLCCVVKRPYLIKIEYYDINGEKLTETLKGFISTVFSHEYDHLNGVLHIDYPSKVLSLDYNERQEYRAQHPYEVISEDCEYEDNIKKD